MRRNAYRYTSGKNVWLILTICWLIWRLLRCLFIFSRSCFQLLRASR